MKMLDIESIFQSGALTPELREALRTFLAQNDQPYLDIPETSDGPGVCICTSLANLRRIIEAEYREKLDSQPRVLANYSLSGRRKLPDAPIVLPVSKRSS